MHKILTTTFHDRIMSQCMSILQDHGELGTLQPTSKTYTFSMVTKLKKEKSESCTCTIFLQN